MGTSILLQHNLPELLRQRVQMLGATPYEKILGEHILETITEEWNQLYYKENAYC